MNTAFIHPIVVHIPVGLLAVYSLLEIARFRFMTRLPSYEAVKAAFVIIGTAGAFMALSTGELAEHAYPGMHDLIEVHAAFATVTTWVFTALSWGYACRAITSSPSIMPYISRSPFLERCVRLSVRFLLNPAVSILLAAIGLAVLGITGGLGGAITRGPGFDPLMTPVMRLLGLFP